MITKEGEPENFSFDDPSTLLSEITSRFKDLKGRNDASVLLDQLVMSLAAQTLPDSVFSVPLNEDRYLQLPTGNFTIARHQGVLDFIRDSLGGVEVSKEVAVGSPQPPVSPQGYLRKWSEDKEIKENPKIPLRFP